jgi:hypothetical protein
MRPSAAVALGMLLAIIVNHRVFFHAADSNIVTQRVVKMPSGRCVRYAPYIVPCTGAAEKKKV